jgi:cold shock CspA family protein
MSSSGTVKSFNPMKGWGFIDVGGSDVFVHIKDCIGGQPKEGDVLTFDLEPRQSNPEHMQAKNASGGTGPRTQGPFTGPVEGTGAYTGTVKAVGSKGFGFITCEDGSDVFMHHRDYVGSKPVVGDKVKFDIVPSESRPGDRQAKNITGGTAPLDPPFSAMMGKGWGPAWGAPMGKGGYGGGYDGGYDSSYGGGYGSGYSAPSKGGYSAPSKGGYSAPSKGGYSAPSKGGYSAPSKGGYAAAPSYGAAPSKGGYAPKGGPYGGAPAGGKSWGKGAAQWW